MESKTEEQKITVNLIPIVGVKESDSISLIAEMNLTDENNRIDSPAGLTSIAHALLRFSLDDHKKSCLYSKITQKPCNVETALQKAMNALSPLVIDGLYEFNNKLREKE